MLNYASDGCLQTTETIDYRYCVINEMQIFFFPSLIPGKLRVDQRITKCLSHFHSVFFFVVVFYTFNGIRWVINDSLPQMMSQLC